MIVGIYDYDYFHNLSIDFNLECMKLYKYHVNKHDFVSFVNNLDNIDKYNKFIIRRDMISDDITYEFKKDNIEFGGLYFTNGIYKPLNQKIETLIPDTYIYEPFNNAGNSFYTDKINRERRKTNLIGHHLRISLDGKNIWDQYEKQFCITNNRSQSFIIHDNNLQDIKDFELVLHDLSIPRGKRTNVLINKFPLYFHDLDLFESCLHNISKYGNTKFSWGWDKPLTEEDCIKIIKIYLQNTDTHQRNGFFYKVDLILDKSIFYNETLPKIYQVIRFFNNNRIKILLKTDNQNNIFNNWFLLLNNFYKVLPGKSLATLLWCYKDEILPPRPIILNMLIEAFDYNPSLKKLFIEEW